MAEETGQSVPVWLVERTYSDDEQNVIILIYATPDGSQYHRQERALTSLDAVPDVTAAVAVPPRNLGEVLDPELRSEYAETASRMRRRHDPDDTV